MPPVTRIAFIGLLTVFILSVGVANALAADRVFLGQTLGLPLTASADRGTAQTLNVLRQQAAKNGATRVIVGVRAAFAPEGLMAAASVTQQRDEIATMQSAVLDRVLSLQQRPATIKRFKFIPFMALEVTPAELDALASLPEITSIEEDRLAAPQLAESVPLIGGATAWGSGYTGAGQTVAILDTGVDKTHLFLAGKVVSEACYSTDSFLLASTPLCPFGVTQSTLSGSAMPYAGTCPTAKCDHGTHVAGIAAGNGAGAGVSYSGVAKDASLIAIQVFSRIDLAFYCALRNEAAPCVSSYTSDQILGLERVLALSSTYNIAAVNMSIGGGQYSSQSTCDSDNTPIKTAIDNLRAANIATVVSSGNDGYTSSMGAPGCISSAVSVGATWDVADYTDDKLPSGNNCKGHDLGASSVDEIACYSNSASFLNLLAPGSAINSSIPGGGSKVEHGTSMAAPHVAGAWALLKQKKTTLTVTEGLTALSLTGVSVTDPRNSIVKPRIKIDDALDALPTIVFQDNMESGPGGWFAQSPWGQTTITSHSATHSWTDSPGGNYANNANTSLWSPALNLSAVNSAALTYWHRYDVENGFDFGNVYITTDNGLTFTKVASFTGTNTTWTQATIVLDAFAGQPSVRIVFQLTSDSSATRDGWYIDDVVVARSNLILAFTPTQSGNGRAVAFDPATRRIFYTVTSSTDIFITDANNTPAVRVSPGILFGALAWDAKRGVLWGGAYQNSELGNVYQITPGGVKTFRFKFIPPGGSCYSDPAGFIDGLAYDEGPTLADSDDTLWISDDAGLMLHRVGLSGNLIASFPTPNNPRSGNRGCNTGIAVDGEFLWLGLQSGPDEPPHDVVQVAKSDPTTIISSFPFSDSESLGPEGLALDIITIGGTRGLWSNEFGIRNELKLWEIGLLHTVTVASSDPSSGVSITVSPNDNNSQGNGTTQFTRTYNNNTVVNLTAPSTAGGNNFQKWQRDGVDWSTNLSTQVTMDADHTMTSVYVAPATPDTIINSNPASVTNSTTASFSFTSTLTGSTFECSLDGAAFAACTNPKSYSRLKAGQHNFQVRATDTAGRTDPTPANFDWTIDTTAPNTTITSKPPTLSNNPLATFAFSSTEPNSTFECSLDGGAFAACASPWTSNPLTDGKHTFQVRAVDAAGNRAKRAVKLSWTLDATPPDTTITRGPTNPTTSTSAKFSFKSSEKKGTFQCNVDGAGFTSCKSGQKYSGLLPGFHTFQVQATDAAGNIELTPASYDWTIQ